MTNGETPPDPDDDAPSEPTASADGRRERERARGDPHGPVRSAVRYAAVETRTGELIIYDRQCEEAWIQSDHAVELGGGESTTDRTDQ